MDLQLKDRVVIVTGGAQGIGAAIVRACAEEGAVPVILDRNADAAGTLQSELHGAGTRCHVIAADISEATICLQAVAQICEKAGRIDGLVNNAGVNDKVGLERGNPEEYVASLKRNLLHYFNMAHYALPHLKQSRGAIVNIASKTALTGQGGTSGYASSKGAILALTREWAVELLDYGIRVNALAPGFFPSKMSEGLLKVLDKQILGMTPMGRLGGDEDLMGPAIFLASDAASYVTGQILSVDGGMTMA